MKLELREYQTEALCVLLEYAKQAAETRDSSSKSSQELPRRLLCIQPTGAGKTILILAFVAEVAPRFGWKTLLVVPSRTLVAQTTERARHFFPSLNVSKIGEGCFDLSGDFVVATSASLAGEKLRRVPPDYFSVLIADEAHHAAARSYKEMLDYFSSAYLQIGVTATHVRGDGESIASPDYFGTVAVWNTISQLTRAGYLVPAFGFYAQTATSLEGLKIKNGDFVERELSRTVNNPARNDVAVMAYFEHLPNRQTVCFAVDVAHARALSQNFQENGIRAEAVWGAMNREKYEEIMRSFVRGETQVLVNAKLLVEGWDCPQTSGIIVARPATEASAAVLGPQMIGRALRPSVSTGKTDAVIVELRDCDSAKTSGGRRATLLGAISESSSDDDLSSCVSLHEQADFNRALSSWKIRENLRSSLLISENAVRFFDVIEEIERASRFAWVPLGACLYMPLEDGDFLEIVETAPVCYEIRGCVKGDFHVVGCGCSRANALAIADSWLSAHIKSSRLIRRDEPWRKREASEKQILRAAELTGLNVTQLSNLTSGQTSDLIRSAYALILSPEELVFARAGLSVGANSANIPHAWQINGSNSA
ncbi:MAG: DEAD/DEAH box helicase [Pyrinomonadaceae bacterium]